MLVSHRRFRPVTVVGLVVGLVVGVAALGACSGDDAEGGGDRHEADVYAAIVRAAAPTPADDQTPVVFVAPHGEATQVALDTQVAVVDRLGDEVTVRFVDETDEAIDEESGTGQVRDDGVLVRIGPVPDGRGPMTVTAERIASDDDRVEIDYTVSTTVTEDGDVWTAVPAAERPLPTTVPPVDG